MICDFNNPISMRYVDLSLESFKAVEDLIHITPVQCTTPATLPIRYRKTVQGEENCPHYVSELPDHCRPRHYGGTFCDDPIYNCIMHSHMQYVKRIAQGEELMIMEHDAALINEDSFREMFDMFWGADTFFPGACMELYGLSPRFANWLYNLMEDFPFFEKKNGYYDDLRFSGPMGIITHCRQLGFRGEGQTFLMPTKDNVDLDKICYTAGPVSSQKGHGPLYDPCAKQYYFTKSKNTNSPDYSDIMEDETLDYSASGAMRRDFIFIDG
jgi:hypothetical protein